MSKATKKELEDTLYKIIEILDRGYAIDEGLYEIRLLIKSKIKIKESDNFGGRYIGEALQSLIK